MSDKKTNTATQVPETTEATQVPETTQVVDPMEELVDFTPPIDPTGKQKYVLLSVNGAAIRVKLGATVKIKRKFMEVWNNSIKQKNAALQAMEEAEKGSKAPIMEM